MPSTIGQLAKHSAIYGLGSLLNKALGFLLLPIYTRHLSPADYGVFALLSTTGSLCAVVAQLGLGSALFREVIHQRSDEKVVQSTAFYLLGAESALFFGALIFFAPQICSLLFGNPFYGNWLRLTLLADFLGVLHIVFVAKLRIHERSVLYSTVALTRFLVGASLNIYFVAVLHRGVFGLIFSELISAVLFSPVYLWHLVPDLGLTFSRPILGRLLAFGLPGVPSSLASMAMSYVDRFFLQHYCSTKEVGLYSLGYSIGLVINLAVQAVQLAWPAHMFVIARRPDAEKQLSKMLTYYVAGMGFAGLSVSVLTPEILTIMTTPQFYPAGTVVPFITVSYVLYGTRFMVNSGLEIHNKLYYSALIIVGSALMNLLLNFLLIPPYGMLGAAVATLLSYGVLLLAQASVNLRFWHIPYQYGRLIKVALTWGAIFGASLLIHASSPWLNGALKLLLLATYPLLLYGLSFFEASELAKIRQLLRIGSNPNP